ncbi:hypothetical protein [Myxosarcina sp. GI1(2024)]
MNHFNDLSDRDRTDELAECMANCKQIFRLIDGVLPLELCLHHEILPMELNSDRLTIGMVNLEDKDALNFIRPIINSFGYTLNPKLIDSQTHQQILVNYLKKPNSAELPDEPRHSNYAPTVIGRPDELPELPDEPLSSDLVNKSVERTEKPVFDRSMTLTEIPPDFNLAEMSEPATNTTKSTHQTKSATVDSTAKIANESATDSSNPFPDATPHQVWQKLYNQLLDGEIDRLCLRSNHNLCKITGSRLDTIELAWERIEPAVFTAIVNKIKALLKLPPVPLKQPKKVALEKLRDRERVLLRIELTPSHQGEEIIFTAMRGKTLQSHKQKQIDQMGEQALFLALKLENILKKLRLSSAHGEPKNLAALKTALAEIESQLELMN